MRYATALQTFVFAWVGFSLTSGGAWVAEIPSLADLLLPYRKTLAAPFDTYHYATRESAQVQATGPLDPSRPELARHVADWAAYYWDLSQPGGTGMVRGLYLATEPVISRDFGKENWLLYRVTLPAGLSYLDMTEVEHDLRTIPEEGLRRLRAHGCDETRWTYLIYKSFQTPCREIGLQTLRDLGVDLIQYDWQAGVFEACPKRTEDAFILLRTDWMTAASSRLFYREASLPDPSPAELRERQFIAAAFGRIRKNPDDSSSSSPEWIARSYALRPWAELESSLDADQFAAELRARIRGCESAALPVEPRELTPSED